MPKTDHLKPPWKPGESGNPNGRPPGITGRKTMATVVREMLEDEEFEIKFKNGETRKWPAKIITEVLVRKAASGDVQAYNALVKSGYGDKVDVTTQGDKISQPVVYLPSREEPNGND